MKEVKELRVVGYEANDGTIFTRQEECIKYENSAKGVVSAKYNKYIVKKTNECELFKCGNEDEDSVDLYKVTPESIDILRQLLILDKYTNTSRNNEFLDNIDYYSKDLLIIYRGYERDNYCIMGSLNSYIQQFNNLKQLCE